MRRSLLPGVRPADGWLALALAVGVLASVVWALLAWSLWPSVAGCWRMRAKSAGAPSSRSCIRSPRGRCSPHSR